MQTWMQNIFMQYISVITTSDRSFKTRRLRHHGASESSDKYGVEIIKLGSAIQILLFATYESIFTLANV